MATAQEARRQLSDDLGDYFVSTTTGAAADAKDLIDAALLEQNNDEFPTKQATAFIKGGQVGGPVGDEERAIDTLTSLSSKLTMKRAFSVLTGSGVEYEAHRIFTAAEKTRAITTALNLCFPIVFKRAQGEITMVADQYDYDISSLAFYRNEPRQVHLVSLSDTELTQELHSWDVRDGVKLHLGFRPVDAQKLRLFGIKQPALSDLDTTTTMLIITARAAWHLYDQGIAGKPSDFVGRYQGLREQAKAMFQERMTKYQPVGVSATIRTEVFDQGVVDVNWSVP